MEIDIGNLCTDFCWGRVNMAGIREHEIEYYYNQRNKGFSNWSELTSKDRQQVIREFDEEIRQAMKDSEVKYVQSKNTYNFYTSTSTFA